MLRARLRGIQRRLAPAGTRRHKYLRTIWRGARGLGGPPRLTFLIPVDDPACDATALEVTLASLNTQSDPRWQALLVGDRAETLRAAVPTVENDDQIVTFTGSGDLASRLNAATAAARAPLVAVVSPGDDVLTHAVRALDRTAQDRNADVVYGDEVDLSKPDWSPNHLLAFPYVGRVCAFRKETIAQLGGWTQETVAAEDYRLLLAALRAGTRVCRADATVYARATPARVSLVTPAAVDARRKALLEHFAATGEPAQVVPDGGPSQLRVRWPIDGQPLVSIVIATRDRLKLLRQCIESIEQRSTYGAWEIVIVDNDSTEADTLEYFAQTKHRVVKAPGAFNFSHINNEGARAARGEFVVFLNNDTEIITPAWIEEMLQYAARPGAGCVGAKLLFGDGRVQHGGVVMHDGSAHHLGYLLSSGPDTWPLVELVRDVSGVTGACMMIHRQRFLDAGGFDETFPVNYNDTELCLRLRGLGYHHVYTPYAALYHHESSSRVPGVAAEEGWHLRQVCGEGLWTDPFCPRAEILGTPRWALQSRVGHTLTRVNNMFRRGWASARGAAWQPQPLLGMRPFLTEPEQDAIRWIDRVDIAGQVRPALFMHPPSRRVYRFRAPRAGRFQAWLALMPEVWERNHGGVRFHLTIAADGRAPVTRTWRIDPHRRRSHRAWVPITVPFRGRPGTTIELTLSTETPEDAAPAYGWGLWGQPFVAERRPYREVAARHLRIIKTHGWRAAASHYVLVLRGRAAPSAGVYDAWFRRRLDSARLADDTDARLAALKYRPRISIVTPVFNTPPELLQRMVDSVREQLYPDWQLCLADDASTKAETRAAIDAIEHSDTRITVVRQPVNGGISAASNAALAAADGEFIALVDHDDEITPDALLEVVERLNRHPDADVIYSDEDKLDERGQYVEPFFKPDWSPEYLNSTMFLGHLVVYRRSVVNEVGGFRSAFDGSQDYDLALRVTERTDRIQHVPHVLYHWRINPGSAAGSTDAKPWGLQAARRALVDHVSRLPVQATVEDQPGDGFWRVRYEIAGTPKVSVLIPTAGTIRQTASGPRDLPLGCVRSIVDRTDYPHYEIVLAVNGPLSEELTRYAAGEPRIRIVTCERSGPFNFAATINCAAREASGDHLLLLNDDTEVISAEWMRAMLEFSQQRAIGAVGAKLLFPDGRLQHTGVIVGIGGGACHVLSGHPGDTPGYYGGSWIIRNYSAVTGACLMTRREVWDALGGMDERFATDFNDVDYCLRARQAGYRIVVTPYARLYHFEGASFGNREHKVNPREVALMSERWAEAIANDPYYNPNLTRTALDYSLRLD